MTNPVAAASSGQSLMHLEAAEAPSVVGRLLSTQSDQFLEIGAQLRRQPPELIVTNARGSSDHASVFGKYVIMGELGIPVLSGQPSLASIYDRPLRLHGALSVSVSQSGQSPDIVAAAKAHSAAGARCVAFTNTLSSPLTSYAEHTIDLSAGNERSVAATKTYISSLVAYLALVASWKENQLMTEMAGLTDSMIAASSLDWTDALNALSDCNGLFVIGRGPGLGIANEAALKFKETCQIHAEAYSAAECSHGPLAMVGPQFPALIIVQNDAAREGTISLGKRMVELGAKVLVAGADIPGAVVLPTLDVHPLLQPITMIQSFYKMVADLAVSRGQNPDSPPALRKVTETY